MLELEILLPTLTYKLTEIQEQIIILQIQIDGIIIFNV